MSLNQRANIRKTIEELLVDVAWGQWAKMSSLVSRRSVDAQAIIDPETLLLSSIIGSGREKRLLDLAAGWLQQGARLVSTQRTRTLASRLPADQKDVFATIAALAVQAGDHRWKPYAMPQSGADVSTVRVKDLGPLRLDVPQSLMLRLRAGFGMGTKADVLAMLLGMDEPMTLRAISENLSYGVRPLRLALEDMVLAGFVERVASTPAAFRITDAQWTSLLNGGFNSIPKHANTPPTWQPWSDVMVLCSHIISWSRDADLHDASPYVVASRSRDILDSFLTPTLVGRFALKGATASERWELQSLERFVSEFDAQVRKVA
jgi:hypothetical protein